ISPSLKRPSSALPSGTSKCLQMLSANTGFAVPEKILNRSSFTTLALRVTTQQPHQLACQRTGKIIESKMTRRDAEAESTTRGQISLRCASDERTCRARWSRKRRSDRAETQQRLGAPSLGSGKLQTPPNRYPPARLLQLLFGATRA